MTTEKAAIFYNIHTMIDNHHRTKKGLDIKVYKKLKNPSSSNSIMHSPNNFLLF